MSKDRGRHVRITFAALLTATSLSLAAATASASAAGTPANGGGSARATAAHTVAHSVRFEPNLGQTNSAAKFVVNGGGPAAFLTANDALFVLAKPAPSSNSGTKASSAADQFSGGAVVRMHLRNANPAPQITNANQLSGTTNYLIGKDRTKWVTGVPAYGQVTYHDIYPGIDLVYHAAADGSLEYDFDVNPGADASTIDLEFQGADNVAAGTSGGLAVSTAAGQLTWAAPQLSQQVNGSQHKVSGGYTTRPGNRVGFTVGSHDSSQELVIDPQLTYSTYLGGSSGLGNQGNAITTDASGNTYVTGEAMTVVDFPTTPGAFQTTFPGTSSPPEFNAFVSKLSPNGSSLVYSTFLGGSGSGCFFCGDQGFGIAVNSQGDAYITGNTTSANFPVTTSAFQTTFQGGSGFVRNAFLTELNAQGSALVYSTFLGAPGNQNQGEHGRAVSIDPSGDALVAGNTDGNNFPLTTNAYQAACPSNCQTNADGVSTAGSTTYTSAAADFNPTDVGQSISGTNIPSGTSVASVETPTSLTLSAPATASGTGLTFTVLGYGREQGGAFLARFDTAASGTASLVYSSLFTGGVGDFLTGMATDGSGNAYLTGSTASADLPTTSGAYQRTCTRCDNYTDGSVASNLTTLTSPTANFTQNDVGSTIFGKHLTVGSTIATVVNATTATLSTPAISAGSTNFIILFRGGAGASFVAELNPALGTSGLVSSTFFADNSSSTNGIAVDSGGAAYVTGQTSSATFPTTSGAFEPLCHQSTNSPCGSNPTFTDGVTTSGSATFTSASANFDPVTDPGQTLTAPNVPAGTSIVQVVNPTTVLLSAPATATATGLTFSFSRNNSPEGFVTKFAAGETSLAYSTYLGGVPGNAAFAIGVDSAGHAVVVGGTFEAGAYPVADPVAPPLAGFAGTATEMKADGSGVVWSTTFGGAQDQALAVSVDSAGAAHVTGVTTSSSFPVTTGAFQTVYGGAQGNREGNGFVLEIAPVSSSLPIVTGVSPSHGPLSGGMPVVISGHGFTGATAVNFGGVAATFSVNSDTLITATSPVQAAPASGTTLVAGVTVTTAAGTSPANPINDFTYGAGEWFTTGSLSFARVGASATLLQDGRVLVAGGGASSSFTTSTFNSAEVYDPKSSTWTPTGAMNVGREYQTATLLNNGTVLVVGGASGSGVADEEIYDPKATGCGAGISGCWTTVASLPQPLEGQTATLLPSGKVLVAGGDPQGANTEVASALVYDPVANTWTSVGSMAQARAFGTATLLQNGTVLVAGGCCATFGVTTATAEVFNPTATGCGTGIVGCWSTTGSLGEARQGATATLLPSGNVLVSGGNGPRTAPGQALTSMEEYNPSTRTWALVGLMQHPRVGHDAVLLSDGKVLLAGGLSNSWSIGSPLSSSELFDPANPASTTSADSMLEARALLSGNTDLQDAPSFTATLLNNGEVLATGGLDSTAELYSETSLVPAVKSVSPSSGSGSSAVPVTITGTNLSTVTSVTFGAAKTFAIAHDPVHPNTVLTVTSPGTTNSAGGTVDVTVNGPGGTSPKSSADHFTFNPWGFLRVTTPGIPSVISADGNFLDSFGTNWVHEDAGSHSVCFTDIEGWTTPSCQSVTVAAGQTTTVNGAFVQRGFLQVQLSPAGVDGTISVDGTRMDDYGVFTDLPTGSHQVCFSAAKNYTAPPCQNVTLTAGTTTLVTGAYTSSPGAGGQNGTGLLRVTTNPPVASQISVDGTARDTWGLSWLQLPAGPATHQVCFRSVVGFFPPACSTVTITAGQTTVVQGNFTQNGEIRALINPAGPDGVISVDGVARDDYGLWTEVPVGTHTVCWGAVSGKASPACQSVSVTAGTTSIVTGNYQ